MFLIAVGSVYRNAVLRAELSPRRDAHRTGLDDSGGGRVWVSRLVVPGFGPGIRFFVSAGVARCPMCPGQHRLDPRRGGPPSWVAEMVRAGQLGAGRLHSRCQQVTNASFQGQVRLIR